MRIKEEGTILKDIYQIIIKIDEYNDWNKLEKFFNTII